MTDVTQILDDMHGGDRGASERLLPLVYDELRKLAARWVAREPPGQTLQATALVHDAFVRLVAVEHQQRWDSRGHFLLITLFGRRDPVDGALQRSVGLGAGSLALLPICPVHILAIPVSIWVVRVFLCSQEGAHASLDTVLQLPEGETKSAWNWPALYLGATAFVLVLLSLDRDSGLVTRNWLKLTGRARVTLNVRDAGVRVEVNGARQAVTRPGHSTITLVPGEYEVRSLTNGEIIEMFRYEVLRGSRTSFHINDRATQVTIVGYPGETRRESRSMPSPQFNGRSKRRR